MTTKRVPFHFSIKWMTWCLQTREFTYLTLVKVLIKLSTYTLTIAHFWTKKQLYHLRRKINVWTTSVKNPPTLIVSVGCLINAWNFALKQLVVTFCLITKHAVFEGGCTLESIIVINSIFLVNAACKNKK